MKLKKRRKLLIAALGAAMGVAVFLWLYGTDVLDVCWDSWVINGYDEWDVQQHYTGWLMFRNSHWAFPLGLADTLALPEGTLITYTDSLPWISIGLKALRAFLPSTFQWFGWYVLLCFALQGAAGALLTGRGLTGLWGVVFSALGGALFACLPVLWERAFRHTALTSQYIFLFALYFYLEYRDALYKGKPKMPWVFALLSFWAIGIHPYYMPLVCMCSLLASIDCARLHRDYRQAAGQFALTIAGALAGGFLCGALGYAPVPERSAYGYFSMNLNAILNPSSIGGYQWSKVLPVLPQQSGQYDGFNYLGLGILVLVAAALMVTLKRFVCRPSAAKDWWKRNGPLFGACVFLSLFAVSNRICLGSHGIELPLPPFLVGLCSIFRASGRMFYLVGACIVLFGIYRLRELLPHKAGIACAVLTAVLAVQVWDLSGVAAQKRTMLVKGMPLYPYNVMTYSEVDNLGVGHKQMLAVGPLRENRIAQLAMLAGREGLATNINIAISEQYPPEQGDTSAIQAQLLQGVYDQETIYVTTDHHCYETWETVYADDPSVRLFYVFSCYFLWPIPDAA